MVKMKLKDKLVTLFSQGIHFIEAKELSKALFCTSSWLDDVSEEELSLDNICEVFSELTRQELIVFDDCVNKQDFSSKIHWIKMIREIFNSSNNFYDADIVRKTLTKTQNKEPVNKI